MYGGSMFSVIRSDAFTQVPPTIASVQTIIIKVDVKLKIIEKFWINEVF